MVTYKIFWCLKQKNGMELVEPNDNLAKAYFSESEETLQEIGDGSSKLGIYNIRDEIKHGKKLWLQVAENSYALTKLGDFWLKKLVETVLPLAEILIVFGSFAKWLAKRDSDINLIIIPSVDKEAVQKKFKLFTRKISAGFIGWNGFVKAYQGRNALAKEVINHNLIFDNAYKVVNCS